MEDIADFVSEAAKAFFDGSCGDDDFGSVVVSGRGAVAFRHIDIAAGLILNSPHNPKFIKHVVNKREGRIVNKVHAQSCQIYCKFPFRVS